MDTEELKRRPRQQLNLDRRTESNKYSAQHAVSGHMPGTRYMYLALQFRFWAVPAKTSNLIIIAGRPVLLCSRPYTVHRGQNHRAASNSEGSRSLESMAIE